MAKKRKRHGNSLKNTDPHHLYEIRDVQENDIFKYGISHDPEKPPHLRKLLVSGVFFLLKNNHSTAFGNCCPQ